MAEQRNTVAGAVGGAGKGLQSDAAKQGRVLRSARMKELNDGQKFALGVVRQARNACKLLSAKAEAGKLIPSNVLEAASQLSGAVSSALFD